MYLEAFLWFRVMFDNVDSLIVKKMRSQFDLALFGAHCIHFRRSLGRLKAVTDSFQTTQPSPKTYVISKGNLCDFSKSDAIWWDNGIFQGLSICDL